MASYEGEMMGGIFSTVGKKLKQVATYATTGTAGKVLKKVGAGINPILGAQIKIASILKSSLKKKQVDPIVETTSVTSYATESTPPVFYPPVSQPFSTPSVSTGMVSPETTENRPSKIPLFIGGAIALGAVVYFISRKKTV
jgi:hypothetical protein